MNPNAGLLPYFTLGIAIICVPLLLKIFDKDHRDGIMLFYTLAPVIHTIIFYVIDIFFFKNWWFSFMDWSRGLRLHVGVFALLILLTILCRRHRYAKVRENL